MPTSPSPTLIPEGVAPTTPYTLQEDYTSTAVGKGASLIAISDPGDCFEATDVEGALQELCSGMGSAEALHVSLIDEGDYYESSNAEGALQEVGASLSAIAETLTGLPAANVTLVDEGDYYESSTVEGALQEIGAGLNTVGTVTSGTWEATPIAPIYGGTGITSYVLGDMLYADEANHLAKLSGNTTATKKVLTQTGNGTVSSAPAWDTVTKTDVGLSLVENTALSTWTGSSHLTTLGSVTGGSIPASLVTIIDEGDYYESSDVEGALQEIGASKGQPFGLATLDEGGKVNIEQLPTPYPLHFIGTWDAATNTPDIAEIAVEGNAWIVSVAGETNLSGITDWQIGDWALYDGVQWYKLDNSNAVISVNGYSGVVTIAKSDVGLSLVENTALSTWTGSSFITTVGTITVGLWGGDPIGSAKGGTGIVEYAEGDLLYGNSVGGLTQLPGNTTLTAKFLKQTGTGVTSAPPAWDVVTKTDVGLSNVEDTALSTWSGSTNLTTVGTLTTGTWESTSIGVTYGGTGAANASDARTNLGLSIGEDVQAYSEALASWSSLEGPGLPYMTDGTTATLLTFTENKGFYTTAVNAIALYDLTATGRALSALSVTEIGQLIYGTGEASVALLNGNTTSTKKVLTQTGTGTVSAAPAWDTVTKTDVGLSNVENTALSTWTGSTNLTTLGTVSSGVWQGSQISSAYGGTGIDSYVLGELLYGNNSNSVSKLSGNTTSTKKVLTQTGTGTVSAAPAWDTVTKTDVGLSNVENTALSTWSGSTNLTSLGAIATGTWQASVIGQSYGGTGFSTYALGDTLYSNGLNTLAKLSGNTTSTKKVLTQTGTGTVSAAPAWDTVTKTDVGLSLVENTALSTWTGSTNLTTLGTITTGTWSGTTIALNKGGTGQTTKAAAYDALSPLSALGDVLYGGASGTGTRLSGNTTSTKKVLTQTGTGTVSAAPAWDTVTKTDVGLSNVENTALSTWVGSANITTLGTIASGTVPAVRCSITDTGGYYTGTTVEAALQELGGSVGTTYRASSNLNFNSTSSSSSSDLTITVTGASVGDVVALGVPSASVVSNTCYTAWVSSSNTVTVRFNNYSNASQNPSSGTFTVIVTSVGGGGGGGG